ncbi:hypothetical protein BGAL_0252g00040 [Botrytis galanthina]|uniref:Rhodopsin domain-containing protein n=1 Tax=Botrytis galanthina TaxID=278940 RepID=A0A4S8QWK1_9HELO|nr:hypothetical protein BGAL_0252g00040 [Botrytis galanthina]
MASPNLSPEYLNAYTGNRVMIADAIILTLSTIFLGLRIYVRSFKTAARGWDDYLLPPAWLLLVGLGVIIFVSISTAGVGRHVEAVAAEDPQKIANLSKLVYVLDWFYVPSNTLSRVSVVLMYLRIFTHRWARFFCWATITFLIANCVATIISAQLECRPLAFLWDKSIEGGSCFDTTLWWRLVNIPNFTADIAILLLPVRTIFGLRASTFRKAGISITCLTGSVGMIASIIRTVEFFISDLDADPTWYSTPTLLWTVVECGMYFSAACLIGLRPLLHKIPCGKNRYTAHSGQQKYGASGLIGSGRGHFSRQGTKQPYRDIDSLTEIINTVTEDGVNLTELGDVKSKVGRENQHFDDQEVGKNNQAGQIHIQTRIDIESSKLQPTPERYYFS